MKFHSSRAVGPEIHVKGKYAV